MRTFALLAVALSLVVPAAARARRPPLRVAFTMDDLPAAGHLPAGLREADVLNGIIDALRAHRVPAVGFFTGSNVDNDPATRAALGRWLTSGFTLGNHTLSHESVRELGWSAFAADIERDQTLIRELTPDGVSHGSLYFRYPYLERGDAHAQGALRRYLAAHGYRVADVTVDFDDWAYSAAFVRCTEQGDAQALEALEASYLDFARAELLWSVEATRKLVGRAVPQVLLVHADTMTAHMLDALLTLFEREGVTFISLDEALRDPAYGAAQGPAHGDGSLIAALSRERRRRLRTFVPHPVRLLDAICR